MANARGYLADYLAALSSTERAEIARQFAIMAAEGQVQQNAPLGAPALAWDGTYYPSTKLLTTMRSSFNGTNTITDFPGLPGVRAVQMIPNGQGNYTKDIAASGTIDLSAVDTLYIPILPGDNNTVNGTMYLNLYIGSGGGVANSKVYRPYMQSKAPGEPFIWEVHLKQALVSTAGSQVDGWQSSSGTIDWSAVTTIGIQVGIIFTGNAHAENVYYIGDIFTSAPKKTGGAVMLGFDGQFSEQLTAAVPILDAVGAKATFYLKQFEIGNAGRMSLSQLQALCANGHKVACHSYSKDLNTNDAAAFPTAQSIADEIGGFETWCQANGLSYIPHHLAIAISNPWDAATDYAREVLASSGYALGGITSYREGNNAYGLMKTNQRLRRWTPKAIYTTPLISSTNLTEVQNLMTLAQTRNGVASFYTHTVKASPDANGTTPTIIQGLVDKAVALGLPFITPDQWFT